MQVLMDSIFKQATSGSVEPLESLHMPERDSVMHTDTPTKSVADDQTEAEFSLEGSPAMTGTCFSAPVQQTLPGHLINML